MSQCLLWGHVSLCVGVAMRAALCRPRNLLELRHVPSLPFLAADPASRHQAESNNTGQEEQERAFLTTTYPPSDIISAWGLGEI